MERSIAKVDRSIRVKGSRAMNILLLLHVIAGFGAFAFTSGIGILVTAIARTRDVRAIRATTRVAVPMARAGGGVIGLTVLLGFATAWREGFSLTSTWLVAAYVLVALLIIVGIGIHQAWAIMLAAKSGAESRRQTFRRTGRGHRRQDQRDRRTRQRAAADRHPLDDGAQTVRPQRSTVKVDRSIT